MHGMKCRNSTDNVEFNEYRFSRIVRFFKQKRRKFCWKLIRHDEREIATRCNRFHGYSRNFVVFAKRRQTTRMDLEIRLFFSFLSFLVVVEDQGKCCQRTVKTSTLNVCFLLDDDIAHDRLPCACMCFLYFIYK